MDKKTRTASCTSITTSFYYQRLLNQSYLKEEHCSFPTSKLQHSKLDLQRFVFSQISFLPFLGGKVLKDFLCTIIYMLYFKAESNFKFWENVTNVT